LKKIVVVFIVIGVLLLALPIAAQIIETHIASLDSDSSSNNNKGNSSGITLPSLTPTHTVRFNTNGGTSVQSQKTASLKSAPATTKADHIFCGWYKDEGLTVAVVYPLSIKADTVLYAKWLRISDSNGCTDADIKGMSSNHSSSALYEITPPRFDLATLAAEGYTIKIEVQYDVYYRKDYDALWDIGYAGAPGYEVYIYNSDYTGTSDEDVPATKSSTTRTLSYTASANSYLNTNIYLKFSTDNIQNIVYFKNIKVTYTCYK